MTVPLLLASLLAWAGLTLLLTELRWFSRRPLTERLAHYVPGAAASRGRAGLLSVESFREAIGPVARSLGARFARLFGVSEELDRRLTRIHAQLGPTEFRVRQIGWSLAGFGAGGLLAAALRPPVAVGVALACAGMLLAFLALEQQVSAASDRWKRAIQLELPVVAEQVAMLLGAGYSLVGALDRVARRGDGAIARDLRRVTGRVRQGASQERALSEWAELTDVAALERFVAVLVLNREASDLGRLLAEEARGIRRDVQRERVEIIEKRGQQVWIPVTVATLLPGAIFIGIPFTAALNAFLG